MVSKKLRLCIGTPNLLTGYALDHLLGGEGVWVGGESLILELLIKQQSLCGIFSTVLTEENLKYILLQFNNGEKQGIGRERRKAPPASSEEPGKEEEWRAEPVC